MARRPARPLLLIDLAVPRDVDPGVAAREGCRLCDIDDLHAVVHANRREREREVAQAERIVAEEVTRLDEWIASRHMVPTISRLRGAVEEIRRAELARMNGRLASLTAEQRDEVERLTVAIVNKILHLPTVRLKELAAEHGSGSYVEALWRLFDLDRPAQADGAAGDGRLVELPAPAERLDASGDHQARASAGDRPSAS